MFYRAIEILSVLVCLWLIWLLNAIWVAKRVRRLGRFCVRMIHCINRFNIQQIAKGRPNSELVSLDIGDPDLNFSYLVLIPVKWYEKRLTRRVLREFRNARAKNPKRFPRVGDSDRGSSSSNSGVQG